VDRRERPHHAVLVTCLMSLADQWPAAARAPWPDLAPQPLLDVLLVSPPVVYLWCWVLLLERAGCAPAGRWPHMIPANRPEDLVRLLLELAW